MAVSLADDVQFKIWIIWKLHSNQPVLVAIDTSEDRANRHVAYDKACDKMNDKVESEYFIEESRLNHLYGQSVHDYGSFKASKHMAAWKRDKNE